VNGPNRKKETKHRKLQNNEKGNDAHKPEARNMERGLSPILILESRVTFEVLLCVRLGAYIDENRETSSDLIDSGRGRGGWRNGYESETIVRDSLGKFLPNKLVRQ
jgi:hypothetical protein